MLKRLLKILFKTILGIILFLLVVATSAYVCSRITIDKEAGQPEEITIYIKTNGVHTDIVMPARNDQMDWTQQIKYSNTPGADSSYHYVAMGWGDKGFYLQTPTWADLKFSVAFKAATGLSSTAIHATYYRELTENESCKKIVISKAQYGRLIQFVRSSLKTDPSAHFININTHANYGPTDAFYEAHGHYCMFYTCNTWANSALKHCGQKCCLWTLFDTGIFLKYR